jgi:hypothetical protein
MNGKGQRLAISAAIAVLALAMCRGEAVSGPFDLMRGWSGGPWDYQYPWAGQGYPCFGFGAPYTWDQPFGVGQAGPYRWGTPFSIPSLFLLDGAPCDPQGDDSASQLTPDPCPPPASGDPAEADTLR